MKERIERLSAEDVEAEIPGDNVVLQARKFVFLGSLVLFLLFLLTAYAAILIAIFGYQETARRLMIWIQTELFSVAGFALAGCLFCIRIAFAEVRIRYVCTHSGMIVYHGPSPYTALEWKAVTSISKTPLPWIGKVWIGGLRCHESSKIPQYLGVGVAYSTKYEVTLMVGDRSDEAHEIVHSLWRADI